MSIQERSEEPYTLVEQVARALGGGGWQPELRRAK
jgi:hypothetical protein